MGTDSNQSANSFYQPGTYQTNTNSTSSSNFGTSTGSLQLPDTSNTTVALSTPIGELKPLKTENIELDPNSNVPQHNMPVQVKDEPRTEPSPTTKASGNNAVVVAASRLKPVSPNNKTSNPHSKVFPKEELLSALFPIWSSLNDLEPEATPFRV